LLQSFMKMTSSSALTLAALFLLTASACPSGVSRSYPTPQPNDLTAHIAEKQKVASSFDAESRMEYWVDDQRIKSTVLVMGESGAKVRFNALNPTGDNVGYDLACDGTNFQFVDFNENCYLDGPCTKTAISQLLRVTLEPDDFLLLAIGSTPIIPDATGEVSWNSKDAQEVLSLVSKDGNFKQRIVLDGKKQAWDVLESTVWNAKGEVEWKLHNKDFKTVKTVDGKSMRVPEKTHFDQPLAKAELSVSWVDRLLNPKLDPVKFSMEIPEGLPRCREKK
jgi:hypothetical protein